jgi:hypothetical protein
MGPFLDTWLPDAVGRLLSGKGTSELAFNGRTVGEGEGSPWQVLSLDADLILEDGRLHEVPGVRELTHALNVPAGEDGTWPLRDLAGRFRLRDGRVVVDSLDLTIPGIAWNLSGGVGLDGGLDLSGLALLDPERVRLPEQMSFLAPYVTDARGRIPVPFRIGGTLKQPAATLDWDGLAARAAEKARAQGAERLTREIEKKIQDPESLDRLKKLLKGDSRKP